MIRQKEYCDICELEHGEGHQKAEIPKIIGRTAFPQLTWTYFKKGLQLFTDQSDKVHMNESWLGNVNKLEFCEHHAKKFNTLLKRFCNNDYKLSALLDEMQEIDDIEWQDKQSKIELKFKKLSKKQES